METLYIENARDRHGYSLCIISAAGCPGRRLFDLLRFDGEAGHYKLFKADILTDNNGTVTIPHLPAGQYKLIEKHGCQAYAARDEWILPVNAEYADIHGVVKLLLCCSQRSCGCSGGCNRNCSNDCGCNRDCCNTCCNRQPVCSCCRGCQCYR